MTARKPIHDNAAMAPRIIIERLECYGRCGVTEEERGKPQLIAIDVELPGFSSAGPRPASTRGLAAIAMPIGIP